MVTRSRWGLAVGVVVTLALVTVFLVLLYAANRDAPHAAPSGPPASTPAATPGAEDSPSTSPSPSVAAPVDPAAECSVDYVVRDAWPGGFTVDVTVHNHAAPLDGWELAWSFEGDEEIGDLWNAVVVRTDGPDVVLRDAGHNAEVPTGGSASFGFVGSGDPAVVPASFELEGRACGPVGTAEPAPSAQGTEPADDGGPSGSSAFYRHDVTRAAAALAEAKGAERALVEKIASTPQAFWLAGPDPAAAAASARDYTEKAAAAKATGVLVIYAVPGRDCGQHSSGGVGESAYARWIDGVAGAIVGEPWVILEPDALAMLGDCEGQGDRVGYLKYAAKALAKAGARVYLDVGHSGWHSPEEAARRLNLVGFDHAVGFSLNVSNYQTTADSVAYGEKISALTGRAHYVIDTSRNGNGSDGTWCNPPGRALGERPHLVDDGSRLDAALWIKLPGESDGTCNGGPPAGQWFHENALELARNSEW